MSRTVSGHVLFEGTKTLGAVNAPGYDVTLDIHRCGTCGVIWGIEQDFIKARQDDHEGWCCPNGHSFVFNGPSEEEKLRSELERERRRADRHAEERRAAEASLRATKGQVTKLKKRVAAGVCPCCGRTFQQLSRHMANKHPDYASPERLAEEAAAE